MFSKVRLPYECGFTPFVDTKRKSKTRYYLVGLIFLLFDYEIQLLLPWTITLHEQNLSSYFCILLFLLLLTIGYVYEWVHGGLDFIDTNDVILINIGKMKKKLYSKVSSFSQNNEKKK